MKQEKELKQISPTETCMEAFGQLDGVTKAVIIFAREGEVEFRSNNLFDWEIRGLLAAVTDAVIAPDEDQDEDE